MQDVLDLPGSSFFLNEPAWFYQRQSLLFKIFCMYVTETEPRLTCPVVFTLFLTCIHVLDVKANCQEGS